VAAAAGFVNSSPVFNAAVVAKLELRKRRRVAFMNLPRKMRGADQDLIEVMRGPGAAVAGKIAPACQSSWLTVLPRPAHHGGGEHNTTHDNSDYNASSITRSVPRLWRDTAWNF
jgi:hypothetical protein